MKKYICMILSACLLLCLAGCGSSQSAPETTPAGSTAPASSAPAETQPQETEVEAGGIAFPYKGVEITMNAPAEPIIAALGEPTKYTEETSCAFDGLDKTYYYGSFYLVTYPLDGKDYVYTLWFADDSVTTAEGVYIGASQADVETAYGVSLDGETSFTWTEGDAKLTVILTDGAVSGIRYDAIVD